MSELKKIEVKGVEEWREYDFGGRVYRIDSPVSVEFRPGGETHRVTGPDGIVHCIPAPGHQSSQLRRSARELKKLNRALPCSHRAPMSSKRISSMGIFAGSCNCTSTARRLNWM